MNDDLEPFAPDDDGGIQYAQTTEPSPIVHLHMGGYHREADLMREVVIALKQCLSIVDAHRRSDFGEGDLAASYARYVIAKLEGGSV